MKMVESIVVAFWDGVQEKSCPWWSDKEKPWSRDWVNPQKSDRLLSQARAAWQQGRWFGRWQSPVLYRIGATSHEGEVMTRSPILAKIWWEVSWRLSRLIFRESPNRHEDELGELWSQWWYESNRIDFGWISWAVACRRKLRHYAGNRGEARARKVN